MKETPLPFIVFAMMTVGFSVSFLASAKARQMLCISCPSQVTTLNLKASNFLSIG